MMLPPQIEDSLLESIRWSSAAASSGARSSSQRYLNWTFVYFHNHANSVAVSFESVDLLINPAWLSVHQIPFKGSYFDCNHYIIPFSCTRYGCVSNRVSFRSAALNEEASAWRQLTLVINKIV
jgi:hypothetical protein